MWLFMYTIDIQYTYWKPELTYVNLLKYEFKDLIIYHIWKCMNDIQDMFNTQGGFPTSDIRG